MSISAVLNTAMSGMQAQERRMTAAAQNVANAQTAGYDRLETTFKASDGGVEAEIAPSGAPTLPGMSNVDLTTEALDVIESELMYKANAAVFEAGADMWDVLATIKRDD